MKLNKLSSAIGAACIAMIGSSAHALPPSAYTTGNTVDFYWSGATAQDSGVLVFALRNCVAGSLTRIQATNNNYVMFCTALPALGLSKTNMAIHKYSVGGSGAGVQPVNDNSQFRFLDLSLLSAANCSANVTLTSANTTFPGFTGTNTSTAAYVAASCSGTVAATATTITSLQTTRVGLSDVEPEFFSTAIGNLTKEPVSSLIFGVPVSTNVYRALQSAQGLATGYCTNQVSTVATGTVTATQQWEYLNECMPSLTRGQIVTAYTQGGSTWAGIGVTGVAGNIYVARRVNSSGTQKTFEALIARTPNSAGSSVKSCVAGVDPFLAGDLGNDDVDSGDPATNCPTGTANVSSVYSASGGGDVRNCLINHAAAGRGAIGILTAEDVAPSGANSWRFVKINGGSSTNRGVAPTHGDVASGGYTFWTVNSLNTISSFISGNADYTALVNKFRTTFDANTVKINQPFGASGVMADYGSLPDPKPARDFTGVSGINPWDKLVGASTLDNCQMPHATNF